MDGLFLIADMSPVVATTSSSRSTSSSDLELSDKKIFLIPISAKL